MRVLKILTCCFIFTVIISSQIFGQPRLYNKSQSWSNGGGGWQGPNGDSWSPYPQQRPPQNNDAAILQGIFGGIADSIIRSGNTNNRSPQYYPQRPQYPQQQYYPQPRYSTQQNYTQPRYTPAPTYTPAVTTVAPKPVAPKNEIVTTKKKPVVSVVKNNVSFQLAPTQAETDARQEIEAGEMIGMLDSDTSQQILLMPSGNPNKAEIMHAWNDVIRKGYKTQDVDAFLEKYGPKGNRTLPAEVIESLTFRQKIANYKDALQAGFLRPDQKDAALLDIRTSEQIFAVGKDPKFTQQMGVKITNMNNFNTMGKLAVAAQNTDNPFLILLQGANQMQMPPMFVSELTGYPVITVDPVADQVLGNDAAPHSRATILIENPDSNGQTVKYMLDKYSYTMEAGHQQELDRAYVISFDPGNGVNQKSYTLGDGYYAWSSDPKTGWDLLKKTIIVEIDNSRYSGQFSYLLNGERQQVAPGEIAEHSSDLPLEVTFHAGRDGTEHRKKLKPGRYIVGLDPAKGTLDLFSAKSVEEAEQKEPPYQASTTIGGNNATQAQRVQALLGQLKPVNGASVSQPDTPKGVSPLGRPKAPAASMEDLLKSIKQPAKDPFQ